MTKNSDNLEIRKVKGNWKFRRSKIREIKSLKITFETFENSNNLEIKKNKRIKPFRRSKMKKIKRLKIRAIKFEN